MHRPRVMLVMEATAGGTARYLETVLPALADQDLELHLVCSARREPRFRCSMERFRRAGITVTELAMTRRIAPLSDAAMGLRLLRLIRRTRPDVVHVHSSKAGAIGRLAAACGIPGALLYTPHAFAFLNDRNPLRSAIYLTLERILARWTGVLVAVSESEAGIAWRHGLAPRNRTVIVPNAIEAAPPARRAPRPSPSGRAIVVGFLGRMEEQKDPVRCVELAAVLKHRGVAAVVLMAGAGRLLRACRDRARRLGVEDRVRFQGHVADAAAFLQMLDVFLVTSRYEGHPYAVLDAMHHGLPVVGFDVPGVRDLVIPEVTGLRVPRGDVSALGDAVARLAGDPALAARLGAEGAQRVCRDHRLDRQVAALAEIYRRCAGGAETLGQDEFAQGIAIG